MKHRILPLLKWLIPAFFILLGLFFYIFVHAHGFLGLICFCIAGIISCYYLMALLAKRHPKAVGIIKTIFTFLLCVGLCICAVTEVLIIHASLGDKNADCPYVVVLGAKVNGTAPSLSLSDRIRAAYQYLNDHPDTIAILSGGQGDDEGISEAQCMFEQLTMLGIDPGRLWLEEQASSTWENLQFSMSLIEEKTGSRPDSVGLISSEYHLFRASLFAKECGVEAIGIPAATSWVSLRINYFAREVAGVWHYLILGGQYHD